MGVFGKSAFYLAEPGIIIGYHGCEKEVRDALVSGKMEMNISNRPHEWLGYGLYFWQYNYERALDFATNPPPGKVIKEPAVLGAIITLGNCLDLIDTGEIKKLKLSFDNFKASMESKGLKLPQNMNSAGAGDSDDRVLRRLDCAVIENLHRQKGRLSPYDSVRGVFVEGKPIYETAGFHEKTHIQICIRNPNCIKGFFIPREDMDWGLTMR